MTTGPQPQREGLVGSLQEFADSVLHLVLTRLEILSTEVVEERYHLTRMVLVGLTVLFCLQVGLMLAVLFAVLMVGNEHRLAAIGIASVVLLAGAAAGALWLRGWLKNRKPMFGATIAELRKDRDRLRRGL